MSNITNNQPSQMETNMDHYTLIENLFNQFIESGGSPKVTEFKKHIDRLIKDKIKPLCSSQGKSGSVGGGWRGEQKAKFAGRGAKWVSVSIDEVSSTLNRFDEESIDTSDYRAWIKSSGYAWIRYTGPRIVQGDNMAAFEVRTVGSTHDCPKTLHYILDSKLSETIKPLNSTPHSMKLEWVHNESVNDVKPSEKEVIVEEPVNDEKPSEVIEVKEEVEEKLQAPTSNDPEEWEAYLAAEGLACDDEYEDFDQLNDDMF